MLLTMFHVVGIGLAVAVGIVFLAVDHSLSRDTPKQPTMARGATMTNCKHECCRNEQRCLSSNGRDAQEPLPASTQSSRVVLPPYRSKIQTPPAATAMRELPLTSQWLGRHKRLGEQQQHTHHDAGHESSLEAHESGLLLMPALGDMLETMQLQVIKQQEASLVPLHRPDLEDGQEMGDRGEFPTQKRLVQHRVADVKSRVVQGRILETSLDMCQGIGRIYDCLPDYYSSNDQVALKGQTKICKILMGTILPSLMKSNMMQLDLKSIQDAHHHGSNGKSLED
jgi:hypothetical protein